MSTDIHVFDLLPAYTLDCLDEEELVRVSEHLAVCAECRAELRSYQAVTDQLALAVPQTAPPSRLKRQLMDRIQPSHPTSSSQPGSSWWQRWTNLMQRTTPVWGLVSLILILLLAIGNLLLWQRINQAEPPTQAQAMRTVSLVGTQAAPGATGLIIISLDGRHGTLVVDDLPTLDPERQYQLWLIQDGQRTSGGVFSVSRDGYGSVWVSSPQPLSSYSAFGITIEPAGGSPGPTGDKVLGGTL
ncbi:MAG: anti-sigma factor [Anaerolineae bacterium]|jgi:anti-sigma-K factor RskA